MSYVLPAAPWDDVSTAFALASTSAAPVLPVAKSTDAVPKGEEQPPKPKRKAYANQACMGCRKRKAKCDAQKPSCSTCLHHQENCVYLSESDGRKAPSGAFVQALRDRVTSLEELNREEKKKSEQKMDELGRRIRLLEMTLLGHSLPVPSSASSSETTPPAGHTLEPARDTQELRTSGSLIAEDGEDTKPTVRRKRKALETDATVDNSDENWVEELHRLTLDEASGELVLSGQHSSHCYPQPPASGSSHASASPSGSLPPMSPSDIGDRGAESAFDWARFLPPELNLTRATHDNILDLFEAWFAPWCSIIDMPRFRRDMIQVLSQSPSHSDDPEISQRTPFYSPLLHNAILTIGCSLHAGDSVPSFPPVVDHPVQATNSVYSFEALFLAETAAPSFATLAGQAFYRMATAMTEREAAKPMISTIRALLLLASYNSSNARPNVGYFYVGTAVRLTSVLGLNVNASKYVKEGVISSDAQIARDNTFFTVYVQDLLWSLSQGRSLTAFHQSDHNLQLPPISEEEDRRPWPRPKVWTPPATALGRLPSGPAWTSTCFSWTIRLAQIQDSIVSTIYALKADRSKVTAGEIDFRLEAWANELPTPLRITYLLGSTPPPHIITLQITYEKTMMVLHRPFYHQNSSWTELSVRRCDAAAAKVVRLLELYDSLYGLEYAPLTSVQSAFMAGTCLILGARKASSRATKRVKTSVESLQVCINALRQMSKVWHWAASTAAVLQTLAGDLLSDVRPSKEALGALPLTSPDYSHAFPQGSAGPDFNTMADSSSMGWNGMPSTDEYDPNNALLPSTDLNFSMSSQPLYQYGFEGELGITGDQGDLFFGYS